MIPTFPVRKGIAQIEKLMKHRHDWVSQNRLHIPLDISSTFPQYKHLKANSFQFEDTARISTRRKSVILLRNKCRMT